MVNIKVEEVDLISDELMIDYELLGKSYLQNKLKVKFLRNTCRGKCKGVPDFKYFVGDKTYFVELKSNHDGLRKDQIRWILNNPDCELTIFYINIIRPKDVGILSKNIIINDSVPLTKYDEKLNKKLDYQFNSFEKDLRTVMGAEEYSFDEIKVVMSMKGYIDMRVEDYLTKLIKGGDLYESKANYLRFLEN